MASILRKQIMNPSAPFSSAPFATIMMIDNVDDLHIPIQLTEQDCNKPFLDILKTMKVNNAITRFHFKNPAQNISFRVNGEYLFDPVSMYLSQGQTGYLVMSLNLISDRSPSPVMRVSHVTLN